MKTMVPIATIIAAFAACVYEPATITEPMPDATESGSPSCAELPPICGAAGDADCCTALEVPGGTFYRGRDLATDGLYGDLGHPAVISPFQLDAFEVTVGRFRRFVDAGMGTRGTPPDPGSGSRSLNGAADQGGWRPSWADNLAAVPPANLYTDLTCDAAHVAWTAAPGANEALPMTCVSWYEAFAFCVWDGGFLPTEAEWNFAASGGSEQRAYPWSAPASSLAADCAHANYAVDYPTGFCTNGAVGAARPVGAASPGGNGRWGHADLGGNVGEWVLDGYAPSYGDPCVDCANLDDSGDRVVRGGDWANDAPAMRASARNHTFPVENRDPKIGFRCARP